MLADEPTPSLDTTLAHQVVETFAALVHEQNRAGVMVTHDLRVVRYCERVVEMEDGCLKNIVSDHSQIEKMAGLQPVV